MKTIEILGGGCAKCQQLHANTETAVRDVGLECRIEKVTDFGEITSRGILLTPALAVDGIVKSAGRLLTVEQIKTLLS